MTTSHTIRSTSVTTENTMTYHTDGGDFVVRHGFAPKLEVGSKVLEVQVRGFGGQSVTELEVVKAKELKTGTKLITNDKRAWTTDGTPWECRSYPHARDSWLRQLVG